MNANEMKLERANEFSEKYTVGKFSFIVLRPQGLDFGPDAFNWEVRTQNGAYVKSGNASTMPTAKAAALQIIETM